MIPIWKIWLKTKILFLQLVHTWNTWTLWRPIDQTWVTKSNCKSDINILFFSNLLYAVCVLQMEKCFTWTGHTKITCLSIPASFFNHSCVPNVFTFHTKEYTKIICNRPIKKGEQVMQFYFLILLLERLNLF